MSIPMEAGPLTWFARQLATTMLQGREPCLVWIEDWGIWEENLHLYYRLRESYGDRRLLHDAPGHLFLGYEIEDMATMLQVAVLNGWGGLILPHLDYANAFFSHDEFVDMFANEESNLKNVLEAITPGRGDAQ